MQLISYLADMHAPATCDCEVEQELISQACGAAREPLQYRQFAQVTQNDFI